MAGIGFALVLSAAIVVCGVLIALGMIVNAKSKSNGSQTNKTGDGNEADNS